LATGCFDEVNIPEETVTVPYEQWRLIAKISGGCCSRKLYWGMATDIRLKDYILYKYKERIKKKGLIILYVINNIKWRRGCCISSVPIREPPLPMIYARYKPI
jgi:hypothetical protein